MNGQYQSNICILEFQVGSWDGLESQNYTPMRLMKQSIEALVQEKQ